MVGPEEILVRDEGRYIAHPHLACLADGSWLLVATSGPRRAVTLHPPLDPDFITIAIRSEDGGLTWSDPQPVPGPHMTGTECSGLTALPDGGVLLDQWRFRWFRATGFDEDLAAGVDEAHLTTSETLQDEMAASLELDGPAPPGLIGWARGGGTFTIWRSGTGGRTWGDPVVPDLGVYAGGYGLRGGVVAAGGHILLPLTDPPFYRHVFLIRSRDGGRTWEPPVTVAEDPQRAFEEPAMLALGGDRILMLLRENVGRQLFATHSKNGGATWSAPIRAGLQGFPAHCLFVGDGRIAAVTADRTKPGTILLTLSDDEGRSWDRTDAIVVAGDLGTHDLGYPTAVLAHDGTIFTAYYRRDSAGVTGVYARRVHISPHHH